MYFGQETLEGSKPILEKHGLEMKVANALLPSARPSYCDSRQFQVFEATQKQTLR